VRRKLEKLENIVQNEPHLIELAAEDTRMHDDTLMGGTTEENTEEAEFLSTFFENVTTRMKAELSCDCTRACTKNNCHCLSNQASNHRCNAWCHPNVRTARHVLV